MLIGFLVFAPKNRPSARTQFSAYIVDKSYRTYFVDIEIKNNGSKEMVIDTIALFYPTGSSYYCRAKLVGNNYETIGGMRVAPGTRGTLHFELDDHGTLPAIQSLYLFLHMMV